MTKVAEFALLQLGRLRCHKRAKQEKSESSVRSKGKERWLSRSGRRGGGHGSENVQEDLDLHAKASLLQQGSDSVTGGKKNGTALMRRRWLGEDGQVIYNAGCPAVFMHVKLRPGVPKLPEHARSCVVPNSPRVCRDFWLPSELPNGYSGENGLDNR